jgi:hypothetical protein
VFFSTSCWQGDWRTDASDGATLKQMKSTERRAALPLSFRCLAPVPFSQWEDELTIQTAEPKGRSRFSAAAFPSSVDQFRPPFTWRPLGPIPLHTAVDKLQLKRRLEVKTTI